MSHLVREKILTALTNPRRAAIRLLLGRDVYSRLYSESDTCSRVIPSNVLEDRMTDVTSSMHEHLNTLYMLVVEKRLKRILELGTWTGESTVAFLLAAKTISGHLTSVDLDSCLSIRKFVKENGLDEYWSFVQGDDMALDWHTPIDCLLIDTSHTYEHTLAELQKYEPFVESGGLIFMHDLISGPGVLRAAKEYVAAHHDLTLYQYFNSCGLGVIFK